MLRRAFLLGALGAAVLAAPAPAATDYLATGGSVFTSLRPTGIGLPQLGASGTVGAGDLPSALRTYHDGGQYDRDLADVAGAAQDYLDARLNGDADGAASTSTPAPAPAPSASGGGAATGGGSSPASSRQTAAGTRCTTRYVRIKRAKGRAALYRRKVTCPKRRTTVRRSAAARPAIVLDIDETSLSNYAGLVASNFSSIGTAIPAAAGTGTAIAPTLALYKDARARGVAVFLVTGRPSLIDSATQSNLRSVGYNQGWDGLQYKPADQGTEAFKAGARAAIEARGYDILVNMGDQESDLDGGHADRAFKLPNPYYFIAD
ncbi:HAD family acid phosphatase [Conexibacter woesei]|uniref:HAD family acid phosphatase n=1 Tax=Conexibacter woesei TaxID=191495 RepID=UPI00041F159F|nr:HAD family acid phosphatase [Conexibacter woesei]